MSLTDLSVKQFVAAVAENTAVPGGGSAAALSGALAAALAAMVGGLTANKKGYEDKQAAMHALAEQAERLARELTDLADADADAYAAVMMAFALPKASEEEMGARQTAIHEATLNAARVPLNVLRKTRPLVDWLALALSDGNRNSYTDALVGVGLALACAQGAFANVMVNLNSLPTQAQTLKVEVEARMLMNEIEHLAQELLHPQT